MNAQPETPAQPGAALESDTRAAGTPRAFAVPTWTEFSNYQVTTVVAAIAIGVTLAWWAKVDISALFENALIRRGQLWRLITSVFPHIDVLHLVFNLYWLWIFGTVVEQAYGHAKTAALMLLFAIGSNSLDFAFADGGVGLSGVGYGLFGLLWALSWRDARFRKVMSPRIIWLFVGWFGFCVVTTLLHIYPVANVAHAGGAIFGILVGLAITAPGYRSLLTSSVASALMFGLWASTFGRPIVNLSPRGGYDEGRRGYDALKANRNQDAARWLRDAVKYQPKISAYWFDLGIAYDRLGNISAARACYERAHTLEPNNAEYSSALHFEDSKK